MICNKPCNNKNEFNYCKTTTCIHPEMWSFIISPEKCLENSKLDNLNKGIDELITEYYKLKIVNDELLEEATENNNNVKMQIYTQCIRYIKHTIESLEKLKGE